MESLQQCVCVNVLCISLVGRRDKERKVTKAIPLQVFGEAGWGWGEGVEIH